MPEAVQILFQQDQPADWCSCLSSSLSISVSFSPLFPFFFLSQVIKICNLILKSHGIRPVRHSSAEPGYVPIDKPISCLSLPPAVEGDTLTLPQSCPPLCLRRLDQQSSADGFCTIFLPSSEEGSDNRLLMLFKGHLKRELFIGSFSISVISSVNAVE